MNSLSDNGTDKGMVRYLRLRSRGVVFGKIERGKRNLFFLKHLME